MKKLAVICFSALLAGGVSSYFGLKIFDSSSDKKEVLSEKTEVQTSVSPTNTQTPTITSTPTPANTLTPTPTLTPAPSLTPTPIAIPAPEFTSEQINGFIESYAGQYNVDPNVLRHIAVCESGFNPSSIHLNYAGLYQFSATVWINYRKEIGEDTNPDLRLNAEEAIQTAAFILATNRAYIWPNCVP